MPTIIIIAFIVCCLINVIYWSVLCVSLRKISERKAPISNPSKVTILVCSKNDSHHLKTLLSYLDLQVSITSSVEVLIVNDFSDSEHSIALTQLHSRFPIKIIIPTQDLIGKKAALITGVKTIKTGVILLTDADCRPREEWVSTLGNQVTKESAVLGYSPFARRSTLVNKWARFEGFITAIQYLGWAAIGKPYLGVGRSLAIHSQAVKSLSLTDLNPSIASGDDDMLIQYLNSAKPSLNNKAFVDTDNPGDWKGYWRQKRRHYSISPSYPLSHKIRLSIFSFTQILILMLGIVSIVLGGGVFVLTVWCVRLLCIALVSWPTFKQLEQSDLWFLLPILDGLLSIYYLVFGMTFLLPKPKTW